MSEISQIKWTTGETFEVTNPTESGRIYSSLGGNIYGDVTRLVSGVAPVGYYSENMSPIAKFWKQWNTNSGEANFVLNSEIKESGTLPTLPSELRFE